MSLQKLRNQLAREFARNRAKTAALAGLTLVALYMWAPLVMRTISGRSGKQAPAERSEQDDGVVRETSQVVARVEPAAGDWEWQSLERWMQQDEYMRPARLPESLRDPFLVAAPAPAEQPQVIEQPPNSTALPSPTRPVPLTPSQAGLQLRAIVVGPRLRSANISGMSYGEGETVRAAIQPSEGADESEAEFLVVVIESNCVVLERHGARYQLELTSSGERKDDDRIQIRTLP